MIDVMNSPKNSLKNFILQQVAKQAITQAEAKQYLLELNGSAETSKAENSSNDIAIVGMAGKFPKAENADEFWDLLRRGINCIDDYPEARRKDFEHILRNPHYTEFLIGDAIKREDIPHAHARAGYLNFIDKFDASFFGIPPAEATFMDPYQRMALETAWETLEDAGYGGDTLSGTATGIFIGKEGTNYSLYRYCSVKDPMQLTGSWESIMASRISYLFNFRGPCLVVDTACSAGLVSVHMAARAILNKECDQAIAGGINLSVTGEFNSRFQGGMNMDSVESDDGVIRTFDGRANGTVWGEGVAFVLLKPLAKALQDGDHIHAIIKGSAINNDGASNGLTAPNAEAQEEVIVKAWENAGINPETLSYVEAHGTGTVLGDPIEFKGLTSAFRRFTQKSQFCAIGSLKTNMGHLVAASGVASLFKVVKSMQHKQLAPTINFGEPNPYIPFTSSPLYVSDRLQSWDIAAGTQRRAALSSFGFSHTNCHMVVEEAPTVVSLAAAKPAYCFTLSAKKIGLLQDYLARFLIFSRSATVFSLADLCYTMNIGRGHYDYRLAIVANDESELSTALEAAIGVINGTATYNGVYFGHYAIVSEKKKERLAGDITDKEKKFFTAEAAQYLQNYLSNTDVFLLHKLAQCYCTGADVNWQDFYHNESRLRLALPTYPFERKRVWADPKITKITSIDTRLHPLIDREIKQSANEWVYESLFSSESHWVLSDHRIMHTAVVPGTTYLEMARCTAQLALGWDSLELSELFFLQPMVVEDEAARRVRVQLTMQDQQVVFVIESTESDAATAQWIRHVEGNIKQLLQAPAVLPDFVKVKQQATEVIENYQGHSDTGVFQFGPHWDVVRAAWSSPHESLARLELADNLRHELQHYHIHPSVLDNAMNLTSQTTGETFLPFMYKSFRFYKPFTRELLTYLVPREPLSAADETQTFNVVLADLQGNVLAEVDGYVTKKVHSFDFTADTQANEFLARRWVQVSIPAPTTTINGRLLVIAADKADAQQLVQGLSHVDINADAVILAPVGDKNIDQEKIFSADVDGFSALLSHYGETLAGIVLATGWGRSVAMDYLQNAEHFARQRALGVDGLFHLVKALLDSKQKLPWGLAVMTSAAQAIDNQITVSNPLGAATAMLGVTAAMENSSLPCRVLDTDITRDPQQLIETLLKLAPGKITALRNGNLYQQELYPRRFTEESPLLFKTEGAYLITGGLGGLGLAAVKHIASHALANVILLGRSPLAERSQWAELAASDRVSNNNRQSRLYTSLLELEHHLGSLTYYQIDVTDEKKLADILAEIKSRFGTINGVFHTAGVAGDGFILRKAFSTFDAVLKPKLEGTRNLLIQLQDQTLDFFVLYSSITALTGGQGQGDYAAANAFMDALSAGHHHPKLIAVNWPSWSDAGMAVDFGIDENQTPFTPITAISAFAKLAKILANNASEIIPADINPALFAEIQTQLPFNLSRELQTMIVRQSSSSSSAEDMENAEVHIRGKSADDLTATEITLAKIYAAVLGLNEIDLFTNFQDMGGNSIIATHLLKVIESYFPGLVDISDVFSYPAIDDMASYIDSKREDFQPIGNKESAVDWERLVDQAVESDEALENILANL
jgi:acyl transferase domain-containing protein